ncbi:MAG: S-layer homology domain-containing protein [Acetivibrionales bacterium]|jgi:hypothetical protein
MMRKIIKHISILLIMAFCLTLAFPVCAAEPMAAEAEALALRQLRLFLGVSTTKIDFQLDKAPTRTQAIIMLIRVLGKESEVLNGNWTHPFTDVDPVADKYIGYAYQNGLVYGYNDKFGTDNATSDMYLTFVLRALGYDDTKADFVWTEPDALAESVGILPDDIDTENFLRADLVRISWAALSAELKDGNQILAEKLMTDGAFTDENYENAKHIAAYNSGTTVSTSAELKAALENGDTTLINIGSDLEITSPIDIVRDGEDGNTVNMVLNIKEGATLTVGEDVTIVGGYNVVNDGTIIINDTFFRALGSFTNNGTIVVKAGGESSSAMTSIYNYGTFTVDSDATMPIDRGSQFFNSGTITNDGYIYVKDGGSLNNTKGTIVNNDVIDLFSYFEGDINEITGTGTVNDNRE